MAKTLVFILMLIVSTGAWALDCSKYTFSKSLCSARLKSNQDYFGPFYRDGNTFRTVGCREGMNRGEKDSNCNSDKCDVISYINVCGVDSFTKDLLPVMAQGEESEIILMTLEKYPAILKKMDPKNTFWNEYFAEKSIFYGNPSHLMLKLSLLDHGFAPEDTPTYKAILENSINRHIDRTPELKKVYESSSFKKDLEQVRADVAWITQSKDASSLVPEKKITQDEFARISANYLNTSKKPADMLDKKVELVLLAQSHGLTPPCYTQNEINDVIRRKVLNANVEQFITTQIDCQKITSKEVIVGLIDQLRNANMLSKSLFDKLYTSLPKDAALTESDILNLSLAVAQFDKEAALKLSLLEFESIEKFATDLKAEDCPKGSKAHEILLDLHKKIINDQTVEFFEKLANPSVSYDELDKFASGKAINYSLIPKGKGFYAILATLPESRFTKDQWEKLVLMGQKPTWENAFNQIGGINDKDDSGPFSDVIKSQNVTLFKLFVDIKKKKFHFTYADQGKAALAINRKSGGNEEIKKILKEDSYFDD